MSRCSAPAFSHPPCPLDSRPTPSCLHPSRNSTSHSNSKISVPDQSALKYDPFITSKFAALTLPCGRKSGRPACALHRSSAPEPRPCGPFAFRPMPPNSASAASAAVPGIPPDKPQKASSKPSKSNSPRKPSTPPIAQRGICLQHPSICDNPNLFSLFRPHVFRLRMPTTIRNKALGWSESTYFTSTLLIPASRIAFNTASRDLSSFSCNFFNPISPFSRASR